MTARLRAERIEHRVAQTGGFCMVIEIPVDGPAFVGITSGEQWNGGDGWLTMRYTDEEDEGTVVMENGPTNEVIAYLRSQI